MMKFVPEEKQEYENILKDDEIEFYCSQSGDNLRDGPFYHAWLRDGTGINLSPSGLLQLFPEDKEEELDDNDSDDSRIYKAGNSNVLSNENNSIQIDNDTDNNKASSDFPGDENVNGDDDGIEINNNLSTNVNKSEILTFRQKNDPSSAERMVEKGDSMLSSSGEYDLYTLHDNPDADSREWHQLLREGGDDTAMKAEQKRMKAAARAAKEAVCQLIF
eukprot:g4765.t1